jgi:hypothetical protein
MFVADTPLCINWSDASAVKDHEYTISEMATLWHLYEKDIVGWLKLRDVAEAAGDIEGIRAFASRAAYSRWMRKVLMARLKFRGSGHEPYPNTDFWSFPM